MKLLNILGMSLLLGMGAYAQTPSDAKANVRQAAIDLGAALISKDYEAFMKTTYPEVVQRTEGGKEKMISDLKKQITSMEKSGNIIRAIYPGQPSDMIDTAGEWQCTIPQFMKIKLSGGMLTTETTLIGLSPNKGKTWYFIDAVDQTIHSIRQLFPNISSRLVIPPSPEPKFEASTK